MKQGVAKAAIRYAQMLYKGVDSESFEDEKLPAVKADAKKALEILRIAAQNDTEAMEILAKILYKNAEKNGAELREVLKRYTEKSSSPDPELLLVYSACLRAGIGGVMPDAAAGAEVVVLLREVRLRAALYRARGASISRLPLPRRTAFPAPETDKQG